MLRYGFLGLGLPVIDAGVAVDNPASIRVLEKTGMHPAESKEEDFLEFSMCGEEYLRREGGKKLTPRPPLPRMNSTRPGISLHK